MIRIVLSIAALAIAGSVLFFYTQPTYERVLALETEIGEYDQALKKAAELQALKQSLLSRYNAFNPIDIDRLHKLLPDHVDNVRLVLDLDSLAGRHGMALQNVTLSNPTANSEKGAIGAIGGGRQKFNSLTLKFTTHGTYANFRGFIEELGQSLRIVDPVSLSLQGGSDNSSGQEPRYRYDITIRTYWLK
ncbi:type 4a pilus biogenesis protein PilO [Candidatus Kaiserbacteria bacterium]|nr:type 4a pilus biogenesis protein PilO [Candidatus Kaiserbacteria bacterium]